MFNLAVRCGVEYMFFNIFEKRSQFVQTQFENNVLSWVEEITSLFPGHRELYNSVTHNPQLQFFDIPWVNSVLDTGLGCLDMLSTACANWFGYTGDFFFLVITFSFWMPCYHFHKMLESQQLVRQGLIDAIKCTFLFLP